MQTKNFLKVQFFKGLRVSGSKSNGEAEKLQGSSHRISSLLRYIVKIFSMKKIVVPGHKFYEQKSSVVDQKLRMKKDKAKDKQLKSERKGEIYIYNVRTQEDKEKDI